MGYSVFPLGYRLICHIELVRQLLLRQALLFPPVRNEFPDFGLIHYLDLPLHTAGNIILALKHHIKSVYPCEH